MSLNKLYLQNYILDGYTSLEDAMNDAKFTSQQEAMLQMIMGNNVFVSGPAGSGKSYVIQRYCDIVLENDPETKIFKTSTTGLSALNIGGSTIHSYSGSGITPYKYSDYLNIKNIKNEALYKSSKKKINATKILIIDEVSMLSERQLEFLLDRITDLKNTIDNIQFIFSGDFSQLPPVASKESKVQYGNEVGNFCYNTEPWNRLNMAICFLDKIHRAKDTRLQQLLHNISIGEGFTKQTLDIINSLEVTDKNTEKGTALLLSTNKDVDIINATEQKKNKNKLNVSELEYNEPLAASREWVRQLGIPKEIKLKKGDTVMVTINESDSSYNNIDRYSVPYMISGDDFIEDLTAPPLKNGMIGTFDLYKSYWAFKYKNNELNKEFLYVFPQKYTQEKVYYERVGRKLEKKVEASFSQYPLKLAYAISIHKSQGQTFDHVTCDLSKCWQPGLGYVALSRATNINSLKLLVQNGRAYNNKALEINKDSLEIKKDTLLKSRDLRDKYSELYSIAWEDINNVLDLRFTPDYRKFYKMQSGNTLKANIFDLVKELNYTDNKKDVLEELEEVTVSTKINDIRQFEDTKIDEFIEDVFEVEKDTFEISLSDEFFFTTMTDFYVEAQSKTGLIIRFKKSDVDIKSGKIKSTAEPRIMNWKNFFKLL